MQIVYAEIRDAIVRLYNLLLLTIFSV